MKNLAIVYNNQRKYDEAEVLHKQCLHKMKQMLDENHPQILTTMMNLATTYRMQGKYADAELLYKQCLDKQRSVLGTQHPDTVLTMRNLAAMRSSPF